VRGRNRAGQVLINRGRVGRRNLAGRACGRDFRQAEIENLGVAALGHKDVGGFDVAVDDALGMRGVEGVGDLNAERQERLKVQWPKRGHVLQRLAVEKFHGDEGFAILLADVVDGANVGMVQGGSRLRFTLKTGQRLGISRHFVG